MMSCSLNEIQDSTFSTHGLPEFDSVLEIASLPPWLVEGFGQAAVISVQLVKVSRARFIFHKVLTFKNMAHIKAFHWTAGPSKSFQYVRWSQSNVSLFFHLFFIFFFFAKDDLICTWKSMLLNLVVMLDSFIQIKANYETVNVRNILLQKKPQKLLYMVKRLLQLHTSIIG